MDNLKTNKILAAFLLAGLLAMGGGKIAEILGKANHSTGKLASDNIDVSFENITDTGTEGTKVALGTSEQRGATQGQWRYNTTTGLFEGYDGSTFKSLATAPSIVSVSPTA